jgi:hypothetical protein
MFDVEFCLISFSFQQKKKKKKKTTIDSGMFRPEMLLPMGLPPNVRAIAWGLGLGTLAKQSSVRAVELFCFIFFFFFQILQRTTDDDQVRHQQHSRLVRP